MTQIYLWFNAALYAGFALWCTLRHEPAARASGFVLAEPSAHSEYLVVYGGLQAGLALFYAYLAHNHELHRTGVVFSLLMYAPVVLYRMTTIFVHAPVNNVTRAVAVLELALLVGALLLWFRR